jgi:kinesin family protein 1
MWSVNGNGLDTPSRSDSPAVVELMDWTAARREVADIEQLGDQDLDKLFDDIVKVRTMRGRPESRLDMAGDDSFRFPSASLADESIAEETDPTSNPWGDGMVLTGMGGSGTPALVHDTDTSDTRTEVPELDGSPRLLPTGRFERFGDDVALEQQVLTKQLKSLALEVKRMRSQAASGSAGELPDVEWTPHELMLVRKAVDKWKRLRNFAMAEQMLMVAGDVREANIIAKQMGRRMTYNFTIAEGPVLAPISALKDEGGIIDFEDDVADTCSSPTVSGPQVLIKVIDHESTCELHKSFGTDISAVYTWNVHRFQQQLARMRQVLAVKNKPGYSMHLSVDAPFGDTPPRDFSYIGAARLSLRLLASQMNYAVTVPIFCAYTMEATGSCRVSFKCAPAVWSGVATPDVDALAPDYGPAVDPAPFGHKFALSVQVDGVKGLTSNDFAEVHVQTRLSSIVGPIASDDTFVSPPVNLDKSACSHLLLRRSLAVIVTSDMVSHLSNEYATIEFFARVRDAYLDRLERFDQSCIKDAVPETAEEERPLMRRADTEFVTPEQHDILASVEVLEMGDDGEYAAAEVEDDVVQLHLGVQRQLRVTLRHASGHALKWVRITQVTAGDVRVGKTGAEPFSVPATNVNPQLASNVDYLPDGTSRLVAHGTWDTAAHHCQWLDRRTPSSEHVVVALTFAVELAGVDAPAQLMIDAKFRILKRDARRSSWAFFRASPATSLMAVYALELAPPLARTARDLWRLDTAKRLLPGEEILRGWRPRTIALVRDYGALARVRAASADVQTTKAVLALVDVLASKHAAPAQEALLKRCVALWAREMETRVLFDVERESEAERELAQRLRRLVPDLEPRLVPTVTRVQVK